MLRPPPTSILFPYTTLFRSLSNIYKEELVHHFDTLEKEMDLEMPNDKQIVLTIRNVLKKKNRITESKDKDRKSTRLNSSHVAISYAVFCLKKKKKKKIN